jgi:regulatory protein
MAEEQKLITKIEVQKKNKERVSIFIEGDYAFSCSAELVFTHGIKADKTVDIEKLKEIINEDNYLKCKNAALKLIERSYKSEKEIFDKLLKKEYDEKTIARAMAFLKSYNFLNDEQFATLYIRENIKSQGKNKIKFSLLKKGIDEDVIEEKLKEVDGNAEFRTALSLAEKKYRVLAKSENDYRKIYSKLWEYLLRNGYSKDIIDETLTRIVKPVEQEIIHDEQGTDMEELRRLAEKRYAVVAKSEDNQQKIYRKLSDYLMRRGYSWEEIKKVLKAVVQGSEFEE